MNVGGNLTLDGNLNVTDAGGFGVGVYRLFNYTGSLTNQYDWNFSYNGFTWNQLQEINVLDLISYWVVLNVFY